MHSQLNFEFYIILASTGSKSNQKRSVCYTITLQNVTDCQKTTVTCSFLWGELVFSIKHAK